VDSPQLQHRSPSIRVIAALIVIAIVFVPSDGAVSLWVRTADMPGEVNRILNRAETFGHGAGVIMIALTLLICARPNYRPGLLTAGAALGAGMTANVVKLLVNRTRPSDLADLQASTSPTWAFLGKSSLSEYMTHVVTKSGQSFPSAHTATAFGLATALTALFPAGRWWFATLAVLVALQRVVNGAHYVSDVCIGAVVGMLIGSLVVRTFHRQQQNAKSTRSSHPSRPTLWTSEDSAEAA
jgi:membrane-associated phospholipid phosphatase